MVIDLPNWKVVWSDGLPDDRVTDELGKYMLPVARNVKSRGAMPHAHKDVARWLAESLLRSHGVVSRGAGADDDLFGRLVSAARLWHGMESKTLALVGQPIEAVADVGTMRAGDRRYELLLRFPGQNSPVNDLRNLARLGLSHVVDEWVVQEMFSLLQAYPDASFNVNIEASSATPAMLELVEEIVVGRVVDLSHACFEVTETEPLGWEGVPRFLEGIERLGGEGALDDFGDGYSSFAALSLPGIQYVKIDGRMIIAALTDPAARTIFFGVVEFVHNQGKMVVAEFVSSDALRKLAMALGCDFIQGHLVGRPLPIADWLGQQLGSRALT